MRDEHSFQMDGGLSSEQAEEGLKRHGYNEISEREESKWHRLFRRFWGPIPWMIEAAALLSAFAQRWDDFTIIMILLLVNSGVDYYQESKALNAIRVLKQKLARTALVLRDGRWVQLPSRELVPDDIIKLTIGNIIPADARLTGGGEFLSVDQAALTGESLPVQREAGEEVYANAVVKQGEMRAVVTATGKDTYFGKTVALVAKAQREEHSHFQKMVLTVGNFLIVLTVVMITVIIAVGLYRHEPTLELLVFALVLMISAIPVAMPAVLTVTMAVGGSILARKEAIVSHLAAIEELAGMDVLCSDKTGTLTQNKMEISEPYVVGLENADTLLLYAALACKEENSDPIETPIFAYLKDLGLYEKLSGYTLGKYLPFDPVVKRTEAVMTVNVDGSGLTVTKGAPQVVIELCNDRNFDKAAAYEVVAEFAHKGFRTLGVAYRTDGEEVYRFAGLVPLYNPPRDDSKEAIADAEEKGVDVKMVTGDNIAVAAYIADLLKIGDKIEDVRELKGESIEEYLILSKVLSEAMARKMRPEASEEETASLVAGIVSEVEKQLYAVELPKGSVKKHESEIIAMIEKADGFAQVYPEDKYFIVDELQKAGHIVGMTGDGVNDAPALKKADCGIAVSGATDAARAAADIVLMAPGLHVIVDAVNIARITFERMKSYAIYRIAETIRVIIFMTLAIVIFQFYPITALMIIFLALLNDIPILTIAYDNTKVRQKPVKWDMKEILVLSSWLGIAGVLSSFGLFWLLMSLMHLPLELMQSIFFVKLVIAGHGTIFNTRIDDWFFKQPLPSWKLLSASFVSALAGTLIGVYGFGLMHPIGWGWAMGMWGYAFVWFIFNDLVKMAVLRYYRKNRGTKGSDR
ncbi:plasma-membrane proton-efflux P-type ATPase [Sulfurimonas sp. HSL3-7]|uniref:plasma-membrane proton-efflux P-type ATPase n=1 Tax=Sulfonitrofixus jiaomeiensis TaxID=3131938 RepID=UPI0031F9CA19